MTISEQITSLISKKFFLNQYIYTDVYAKNGLQENEFCDCLIEFASVYVVVQIKERELDNEEAQDDWFRNKVLNKAKKQIKKTYRYFRDENNTIFSKTAELNIDREKELMPVIVFLNPKLHTYDRFVVSQEINSVINIFSYDDFNTMLNTIVMPYDILSYLKYRQVFNAVDTDKLLFDDTDDITVMTRVKDELDYAQLFLTRTYVRDIIKHNINEEYIEFYNQILSDMNEKSGCKKSKFIEGFLRVNYVLAARIAQKWCEFVDLAKQEKFVAPFHFSYEDQVYLFCVLPKDMEKAEFDCRINLCLVYLRYRDKYNTAHLMVFRNEENEQYSVGLMDVDLLNQIPYDTLLQDAIKFFEED